MFRATSKLYVQYRLLSSSASAGISNSPSSFGETSPDLFGCISDPYPEGTLLSNAVSCNNEDAEDQMEAKISDTMRPRPSDFLRRMNIMVRKRDLKSALELLDVDMKIEYVKPNEKHFRVLIWACGRAGYVSKAFELYRGYTDRRFRYNYGIYADLFNACANSPFPKAALPLVRGLKRKLDLKHGVGGLPEEVYNNIIKAFGRCGDLESAFQTVDEMRRAKRGIVLSCNTFAHLMHGCISDTDAGFRHSLIAWRTMIRKKIRPDLRLFNLLLRAVRDCGLGEQQFNSDILNACQVQNLIGERIDNASKTLPNLIEKRPTLSMLPNITSVHDRFALVGGLDGFCRQIYISKSNPDIKTFSLLLAVIDPTEAAETHLLSKMAECGVDPDIDFFNQLIKRRAFRLDHKLGLSTLTLIAQNRLVPDVMTFGCLALCCSERNSCLSLLDDMSNLGFTVSSEIVTPLLNACSIRRSPRDVLEILKRSTILGVKPDLYMMRSLERFYTEFKKDIVTIENKTESPHGIRRSVIWEVENNFIYWRKFCEFYNSWLKKTEVDLPEHPWKQFLTSKDLIKVQQLKKKYN